MVTMKQVHSSHIHAVGHDPVKNELHVEYKNGGRAVYHDVDAAKHQKVMSGASIGKAMHEHVKGQHDHTML